MNELIYSCCMCQNIHSWRNVQYVNLHRSSASLPSSEKWPFKSSVKAAYYELSAAPQLMSVQETRVNDVFKMICVCRSQFSVLLQLLTLSVVRSLVSLQHPCLCRSRFKLLLLQTEDFPILLLYNKRAFEKENNRRFVLWNEMCLSTILQPHLWPLVTDMDQLAAPEYHQLKSSLPSVTHLKVGNEDANPCCPGLRH